MSTIQIDRQFVTDYLQRVALAAEAKGDIKTGLRAIIYLAKICGILTSASRKQKTAEEGSTAELKELENAVRAFESNPIGKSCFDKKGRYVGIEIPPPANPGGRRQAATA